MGGAAQQYRGVRFGTFDVDLAAGELRKSGIRLKLQEQPFRILSLLLERPGEIITRDEIRQKLWANNTFVDFENGLNSAVARLREALSDSATSPRFIETVPRRGYRFIAPVEVLASPVPLTGKHVAPGKQAPHYRLTLTAAILAVAAISTVALGLRWVSGGTEVSFRSVNLTSYLGEEEYPVFSPGGNEIAFSWNGEAQDNYDIYRKVIGPDESLLRLTANPARDYSPAWSPDGRWIAFLRGDPIRRAQVILVPALRGPERTIGEVDPGGLGPGHPPSRKLAWTPDSAGLVVADRDATTNEAGLFLLAIDSGEKQRLTSGHDVGPALSPDGRALAFSRIIAYSVSDIYVLRLAGGFRPVGEPRRISGDVRATASPAWTADGKELVFVGSRDGARTLWRVSAEGSGRPRRLALGESAAFPTVAQRGNRLVYSRRQDARWNIWRLYLPERRETMFTQIASTGGETFPRFSPDGQRIAFQSARSGLHQVWLCTRDGTGLKQLTFFDQGITGSSRWSSDGTRIAFDSTADGQAEVYVISAAGGKPRRLTNHAANDVVPSWSRDGKWVYFSSDRSGVRQIWKVASTGGEARQVTRKGGFISQESSDGKTLYYLNGEEGAFGVWSLPLPGGEETCVIKAIHRRCFQVTEQGIYFAAAGKQAGFSLEFLDFESGETRRIAELEGPMSAGFTVSPDEQTFLYARYAQPEIDLVLVENFR